MFGEVEANSLEGGFLEGFKFPLPFLLTLAKKIAYWMS